MSLQAQLNQELMDYFPEISHFLHTIESKQERDNILSITFREAMMAYKPVIKMNAMELETFEQNLLYYFRQRQETLEAIKWFK